MIPAWLEPALASPDITDACINGTAGIFVDRGAGMERFEPEPRYTHEELRGWVLEALASIGKSWDAKHPFVDGTLPSGHRIHVTFPPLARQGLLVSIRRLGSIQGTDPDAPAKAMARWGGSPLYDPLRQAVRQGDSILISGATGSGKTTLASDLLAEVPARERVIALEDTPELGPFHPHFLSLVSRPPNADGFGEVTLRTLLRQTLRMRPDRIVLGECRGPEVLDLLQALNTGHRGALATLHAHSPRDALRRIELLCLLAGGGAIPVPVIRELLAVGVQWIAQVERTESGRAVTQLHRVEGREGDTILLRPMVQMADCSLWKPSPPPPRKNLAAPLFS